MEKRRMPHDPEQLQITRDRITSVFQYLKALDQLRNPAKRLLREQPWVLYFKDLPDHPSIRKGVLSEARPEKPSKDKAEEIALVSEDDFILKVRRPKLTSAPKPPKEIVDWAKEGWDAIDGQIETFPSRNETDENGETYLVAFEDDPERPRLLEEWKKARDRWVINEHPARKSSKIFENLYELYGRIEREAERAELVLGDGVLNWQRPEGGIHHPVLLQRLQIEFNPGVPEFILREADFRVELYSALFLSMSDVDGKAVGKIREELEKGPYHPLDGDSTSGFLKRLVAYLSAKGEFVEDGEPSGWEDYPRLGRSPAVFLRTRTLGYSTALDSILEDIKKKESFPPSLVNIVGIDGSSSRRIQGHEDQLPNPPLALANEDEDVLLSKAANPEQLQIAKQLSRHGCVLVQGPPGTGKTHTIANLVGHLLAQGKSALITSHTTKALRVLRKQVVPDLQALCVSVLENDLESRKQLESSVQTIVERISASNADLLEKKALALKKRRKDLLEELAKTRLELFKARAGEYESIVIAGQAFSPSDAAKHVKEGAEQDAWIPEPVSAGVPLPLSPSEMLELYESNKTLDNEDEDELSESLPPLSELLSPDDFEQLVNERQRLERKNLRLRAELWEETGNDRHPDEIDGLLQRLRSCVKLLQEADGWKIAAINAGRTGQTHREVWDNLIRLVESVCEEATRAEEALLKYGPTLPADHELADQLRILDQIISHLEKRGRFDWLTLFANRDWKVLLGKLKVAGTQPRRTEHFHALRAAAQLRLSRQTLMIRWENQMVPLGGPGFSKLGEHPESICAQFTQLLRDCLDWHEKIWTPLEKGFSDIGFRWWDLLKEVPPNLAQHGDLLRLRDAAVQLAPPIFESRLDLLRWNRLEATLRKISNCLTLTGRNGVSPVISRLSEAAIGFDVPLYKAAYIRLAQLHEKRSAMERRRDLLRRLEAAAPAWASAIRTRQKPHDNQTLPGNPNSAWVWRQLHSELEARAKTSITQIQEKIEQLNNNTTHAN